MLAQRTWWSLQPSLVAIFTCSPRLVIREFHQSLIRRFYTTKVYIQLLKLVSDGEVKHASCSVSFSQVKAAVHTISTFTLPVFTVATSSRTCLFVLTQFVVRSWSAIAVFSEEVQVRQASSKNTRLFLRCPSESHMVLKVQQMAVLFSRPNNDLLQSLCPPAKWESTDFLQNKLPFYKVQL